MSKRADLLDSIANTIQDYQTSEVTVSLPSHIDCWVKQFDKTVQLKMLREMDYVLKRTYFSLEKVTAFLRGLLRTKKLTGEDPCRFWRGVNFLNIQGGGNSQFEMLALFDAILKEKCGFGVEECGGESKVYVYLDDAIFTGARVHNDLKAWIENEAPHEANLHIIVIATHQGFYYYKNKIKKARDASGKKIKITPWHAIELENRNKYRDSSDVLWPAAIPDDDAVQAYVADMEHEPHFRTARHVGNNSIFSSDEGRQLLEQEFLKAGVQIRGMCPNLNVYQRPLGNSVLETLGFGSLIVTFRNCPNNAPLALWVGDPWYPLFPRITNSQTEINRWITSLTDGEEK